MGKEINLLQETRFDSKHYDSLLDSSSKTTDDILESDQPMYTICCIRVTTFQLSILMSLVAVITQVGLFILRPVYLADLVQVGGDPYVETMVYSIANLFAVFVLSVIRWCCTREFPLLQPKSRYLKAALYGLFAALYSILAAFSSLPSRTRQQLLGILSAASLPNTIICRYVILRKGISIKQLLCAACVLFGVFVALIPDIFSLSPQDGNKYRSINNSHYAQDPHSHYGPNHTHSQISDVVVYGWAWPLVLVGGTIPFGISYIILEEQLKSPEVSFISFVFWAELFRSIALVALFWTTLIPNFGLAEDIETFIRALGRGLYCSFSQDESCKGMIASALTFMFISPTGMMIVIPLTKYGEGAIYTTMIKTLAKLISTLFWTVFVDAGLRGLLWQPQFNIKTAMAFVGLLFIVPATCLYAYLSNRQHTSSNIELKQTR